jgi:hypothetical protein
MLLPSTFGDYDSLIGLANATGDMPQYHKPEALRLASIPENQ